MLSNGRLNFKGKSTEAVSRYITSATSTNSFYKGSESSNKKIWFKKIILMASDGKDKSDFFHDEEITIQFSLGYNIDKDKHDYSIFLMVLSEDKSRVFAAESEIIKSDIVRLKIQKEFLVRGNYSLHTFIHKPQTEAIDNVEDVCGFSIVDNGSS
ncbi:hypothetical protein EON73_05715, partial [bacterium]